MIVILKSNKKMANLAKLFKVTFLISQQLISKVRLKMNGHMKYLMSKSRQWVTKTLFYISKKKYVFYAESYDTQSFQIL